MAKRHLARRGHHHNPITQAEKDAGLAVNQSLRQGRCNSYMGHKMTV